MPPEGREIAGDREPRLACRSNSCPGLGNVSRATCPMDERSARRRREFGEKSMILGRVLKGAGGEWEAGRRAEMKSWLETVEERVLGWIRKNVRTTQAKELPGFLTMLP
jgi:hypothetical protein